MVAAAGFFCSVWTKIGKAIASLEPNEEVALERLHRLSREEIQDDWAQRSIQQIAAIILEKDLPPPKVFVGVSETQMHALERVIALASNVSDEIKQLVIWLLRQSDRLRQEVYVTLPDPDGKIFMGVHSLNTPGGGALLYNALHLLAAPLMVFAIDSGCPECRMATVWITRNRLYPEGGKISLDTAAIAQIDVSPEAVARSM
ncbi:MAG: hypothetical protein PHO20_05540 [Candidatus Peribacteraceae bacterium]|nr:hypothetical protein [Candidatus Peribacteraceae bacterium]MDD5740198.1 hypothetical protein [Candidatus Peribacteraceae bacterium]